MRDSKAGETTGAVEAALLEWLVACRTTAEEHVSKAEDLRPALRVDFGEIFV